MKLRRFNFHVICLLVMFPWLAFSQAPTLFEDTSTLVLRLKGDIRGLLNDRGNYPQYHPLTLTYKGADSILFSLPVKIKARGHFRKLKANCTYPPLLINFSQQKENTLFSQQEKIKLVTPCRDEKYVIREYLVYKLYNLVTPKSFNARLVKILFDDDHAKAKNHEPLYGMLIEEEDQMAHRNNSTLVEGKLLRPEQTKVEDFLNMAVFEYMIGNTDWSVQYFQNVKLIAPDSIALSSTVPYDFDHAGIVGAPYAKPAEALLLNSTKERRYRGYCMKVEQFEKTTAHFNGLKEKIMATYSESKLLEEAYKKSTIKFLEDFFKTINDPKKLKSEFEYPCKAGGTGNVVIKGMRKE
jgi:hypothetical protein